LKFKFEFDAMEQKGDRVRYEVGQMDKRVKKGAAILVIAALALPS